MNEHSETAFLRSRLGFIRMAMQNGASVVPVFAFGQRATYRWWRPDGAPWVRSALAIVSRSVGMVPLAIWGAAGTPLPRRVPMTVVIGAPLTLPRDPDPKPEIVQAGLDAYIEALQALYERHRAKYGHAAIPLRIL